MNRLLRAFDAPTRWMFLAILVFFCVAAPVFADGASEQSSSSTPTGPQLPPPSLEAKGEWLPDPETVRQGLREAEREEVERERALESPEAVAERLRSRQVFAGLDAEAAEALLKGKFAAQLASLNTDPARSLSRADAVRPLGGGAAAVLRNGERSLLDSSIPVEAEDERGELKALDLGLQSTAEGFETENALVDVAIGDVAGDPVEVGNEGLSIAQSGVRVDSATRRFGDQNVFQFETYVDTDTLIAPIAGGVEIFHLLRSSQSPETFAYEIDVPSGAELRPHGDGAIVVNGGETIAMVPPPTAVDAQGTEVPVNLVVRDDSLSLETGHRSSDHAYPILLDPILDAWYWYGDGNSWPGLTNGAWQWTSIPYGQIALGTGDPCYYTCWGRGLYITSTAGNFGPGVHSHWTYSAPNANSYVESVNLPIFLRDAHGCPTYSQPHDYVGYVDNNGNWQPWAWNPTLNASKGGSVILPGWGRAYVVGAGTGPGVNIPCWRDFYVGHAGVWLNDWDNPVVTVLNGVPSGWTDGENPFTINATAVDAGLGVHRVNLLAEGQPIPGEKNPDGCNGLHGKRCPNSYTASFTQTGGSFGQGIRSGSISVSDPTGKSSNFGPFYVKSDVTPPVVALDGKLAEATDADLGQVASEEDVEKLRLPVYNLQIKATDEGTEPNPEHRKRSGVKDIEIWLEEAGQPNKQMPVAWEPTPSCVASCPKEGTYKLELSKLEAAGTHRLEVRATDFVGNVKVRDIEFEYFPATGMKDEYVMHYFPLTDGQSEDEGEPRRPELAVNVMNGNLVYRQVDVDVESSAIVDLKVERYYNSQLPDSENTEWGEGWTLAETPDLKPDGGAPALGAVATMTQDPSIADRYLSLWLNMPTPATTRAGYELRFKLVSTDTYDVRLSKWQAGGETVLASKSAVGFAGGDSLALVDEGSTVSAWTDTGSGFVRLLDADDATYEGGKTGLHGAGNIVRLANFKAGAIAAPPSGISAELAALPVTESFDGSAASAERFQGEWSTLGWAGGGGNAKGAITSIGWRPLSAFSTVNGAFYHQHLDASGGISEEAELRDASGAVESDVALPTEPGQEKFNPELQTTLEKRVGGGYLMTDETGDSATAVAFDQTGRTEALLTDGEAKVDYSYEGGALAEITVEDPGTLVTDDPTEIESTEPEPTDGTPLFHSSFGSTGSGEAEFKKPADVATDSNGDLWVADSEGHRIQHFNPAGEYIDQFGSQGAGNGQLNQPAAIAIDAEGDIWVADKNNHRVQKFSPDGEYLDQVGSQGSSAGLLDRPEGVAIDADGDIWVSDTYNNRIQKFTPQGELIEVVAPEGLGAIKPVGIDAGPEGRIWVADWANNRVAALSESGGFELSFGSVGTEAGQLRRPAGVEADSHGGIWVSESWNSRLQRFDESGDYVDGFGDSGSGDGQFNSLTFNSAPFGFAVGEDRRLWVADHSNNRVQRWDPPYEVSEEALPEDDDPSVVVETDAGLVESVAGEQAGEIAYEHDDGLLTSVEGPEGETAYDYDGDGRMTKVTLSNGTYGEVVYFADGRVKSVTVAPEGTDPKTTHFAYTDSEQRKTEVEVPGAPNITYEIGDDGSLLKWWNTAKPPDLILWGNLYDQREKEKGLWPGDYQLTAKADDVEGIASIQVIVNGDTLVEEFSCEQVDGTPPECPTEPEPLPWVMETEANPPGHMEVEVIATDSDGESTSERFWVDIPEPPPPPAPGTPIAPKFGEIKQFREDYGLEIVFPVSNAIERNERIFNLTNAWHEPNTPAGQVARASWERWGVPLRPPDVAELEYREWFLETNGAHLDAWYQGTKPSSYAGYYIDHKAGGRFRIGFTVDQESAAQALASSLSLVAKDRVESFLSEPDYDWTTLNDAEDTLIESLPTNIALDSAMSDLRLNARENRVKLFTQGVPAAESAVGSILGGGHPVTFQYSANLLAPTSGRTRVTGRMLAGDRIVSLLSEKCTAGFGTYKLGKKLPNGKRPRIKYLLTAGHCNSGAWKGESYYRSAGSKNAFGDVEFDLWTDGPNFGIDAAAIRLKNPDVVPKEIYTGNRRNWGVQPAVQAFVGDLVYFSGSDTDSPNPRGEVVGRAKGAVKGKDGRRSGGYWVEFKRGAVDGDSGAPVFKSDGSAIGLVVGTWNDPEGRRLTLVEPLLHPPNMRAGFIPGILHSPPMAPMYMSTGPGP